MIIGRFIFGWDIVANFWVCCVLLVFGLDNLIACSISTKRKVRVPTELVSKSPPAFEQLFVNWDADQLYQHFVQEGQLTAVKCEFMPNDDPPDGRLVAQIARLGRQQLRV